MAGCNSAKRHSGWKVLFSNRELNFIEGPDQPHDGRVLWAQTIIGPSSASVEIGPKLSVAAKHLRSCPAQ